MRLTYIRLIWVALIMGIAGMAFPAVAAVNSLTLDAASIPAGTTGKVLLRLANGDPCYGFQTDLSLPEGLTLVDAVTVERTAKSVLTANKKEGKERLVLVSLNSPLEGNDGAVCELTLSASGSFRGGQVKLYNGKMSDGGMTDVVLPESSTYISGVADVAVSMADFSITAGESKQIALDLSAVGTLAGLQADIYLPEGLTADASSLAVTDRTAGFTVDGQLSGNRLRVLAYSLGGAVIQGNSGPVFTLTVSADADASGSADIEIKDVRVTDPMAVSISVPDARARVTFIKPSVASVSLTPSEATMKVTEKQQFSASVLPENAENKSVVWSIADPSAASVDGTGLVTALRIGTTTLKVASQEDPEIFATATINVVPTSAGSITLNKTSTTLKATETLDLVATILPETTTDKTVTWSTSDAAVATVDTNGKVTAVAVGKATVTATSANGLKATCEVIVVETPAGSVIIDKDALGISGDNLEMRVGDVKTIKVTVEPETTTDKAVTFASSAPEVATVDADGKVTALALGKTTITITAKSGVSTSITVTVVATPAGSISLNKSSATLQATETLDLIATILPETTTDKSVTWSTSDASIATVDANGKVTAVAVGKTTVTATSANGLKATCEVTVVETPAGSVVIDKESLGITGDNLEMRVGDVKTIKVTVEPETTTDKAVTFASSALEVATIDADGKVTALALGKTTVTITAKSGVSTSITVTVVATPAGSISLNKTEATLKATETLDLIATILPETTTDKSVTWSTSDASISTVDANGNVIAMSVGKATIKATAASGISATCEVTVVETPAGSVVIDKDALGITGEDLEMRVGDVKTVKVTVLPETTTDKSVTYESSNPAVASINADGKITALTLGTTVIKVTAKSGVSTTLNVTVISTPAASISLNKTEATLKATESLELTATILPATTTDKSVTWQSSDESIATVDANGKVTAVAVGKATITATTVNRLKATCEITVVHRDVPDPNATINGEQFDLLSGESLNLKASYTGGLDSGWSFDWRINDSQNPLADKAEYSFVETTAGKYRISVRIVNNCDGELIYDQTFTIAVRVWDLPALPSEDGIEVDAQTSVTGIDGVVRVRQDDTLTLSVEEGRGGYDDSWSYDWSTAGNVIGVGSEIETTATMKEGEAKAIERRTYNVYVRNISPDGAIWAENILSIATDVYRRPATPSSLVRKGDGATHTFVCMLTVTDNQLSPLGYGFVYGYDAADGSEHEIARTPKRYCRASEQVYNNPSNRFWVYAVWTYEDGCTVSSGKRYLDGSVDEEFNASVFDPSQTGTHGSDFSKSDNWIKVSGRSIGISVDSDSDTFVTLFNANGIMIRSLTVEAGTSVRERIDLSTFTDGIYIVKVTSGNEAVSRKFIVK